MLSLFRRTRRKRSEDSKLTVSNHPTEVGELIVDSVATIDGQEGIRALLSCSLVCRAWRRRSQYYLFKEAIITDKADCIDGKVIYDSRKFRRLVAKFPHLVQLFSVLCVSLDALRSYKWAEIVLSSEVLSKCTSVRRLHLFVLDFTKLSLGSQRALETNLRQLTDLDLHRCTFSSPRACVLLLSKLPNLVLVRIAASFVQIDRCDSPDLPAPPFLKPVSWELAQTASHTGSILLAPWIARKPAVVHELRCTMDFIYLAQIRQQRTVPAELLPLVPDAHFVQHIPSEWDQTYWPLKEHTKFLKGCLDLSILRITLILVVESAIRDLTRFLSTMLQPASSSVRSLALHIVVLAEISTGLWDLDTWNLVTAELSPDRWPALKEVVVNVFIIADRNAAPEPLGFNCTVTKHLVQLQLRPLSEMYQVRVMARHGMDPSLHANA